MMQSEAEVTFYNSLLPGSRQPRWAGIVSHRRGALLREAHVTATRSGLEGPHPVA